VRTRWLIDSAARSINALKEGALFLY